MNHARANLRGDFSDVARPSLVDFTGSFRLAFGAIDGGIRGSVNDRIGTNGS